MLCKELGGHWCTTLHEQGTEEHQMKQGTGGMMGGNTGVGGGNTGGSTMENVKSHIPVRPPQLCWHVIC